MNAYDTFDSLKGALSITDSTPPQDAIRDIRFLLNRVQHQVLASQGDSFHRQMYGILFSHAQRQYDLPDAYDEPKAWIEKPETADRRKTLRSLLMAAGILLFALCCVQLYFKREILLMLGCMASAALVGLYFILAPKATPDRIHLTQRINAERLLAQLAASMRAIDRDMESIDLLLPGEGQARLPDDVLEIAAKALEIERAGVEPLPQSLRYAVDALLVQQDITLVEYTPENAPLFQTLPTQRDTRTLAPAMLREGHLVRAGMAIVRNESGEEV